MIGSKNTTGAFGSKFLSFWERRFHLYKKKEGAPGLFFRPSLLAVTSQTERKDFQMFLNLFSKKGELEENAALSAMHEKYYQKIKPTKKIRFNIGDYVWIARLKLMFGRGHD